MLHRLSLEIGDPKNYCTNGIAQNQCIRLLLMDMTIAISKAQISSEMCALHNRVNLTRTHPARMVFAKR